MRRLRPSWRQASVALLTLLPAAVFLQFVALHNRHGIAHDVGSTSNAGSGDAGSGGTSGGSGVAFSSAGGGGSLSGRGASGDEVSGSGGGGGGGTEAAGDASRYCRPLGEVGAVAAAAAVNSTVMLTVSFSVIIR